MQVSELDPEELIRFTGTVVADVSGGGVKLFCEAPADKSVFWIYAGGIVQDGSTSDFSYNVLVDGNIVFRQGAAGFVSSGSSVAVGFNPPGILLSPQVAGGISRLEVIADNVDGDDMIAEALAFIWDAQVGRNLPQKFFWPGTLG